MYVCGFLCHHLSVRWWDSVIDAVYCGVDSVVVAAAVNGCCFS